MKRPTLLETRALRQLVPPLAVALGFACDLPHTNPFDPNYALAIRINAPDTMTRLYQEFDLSADVDPAWRGDPLEWELPSPTSCLSHVGNLRFRVICFPPSASGNVVIPITAKVGPHEKTHGVVLSHRVGSLEAKPCVPDCVGITGNPQDTLNFWMYDSSGYRLDNAAPVPSDFAQSLVSRNPAVAAPIGYLQGGLQLFLIYSVGVPGSTYFVPTRYVSDSILVRVDYPARRVALDCPASIALRETVYLTAVVKGPNDVNLLFTPPMTWNVSSGSSFYEPGSATLRLTAVQRETIAVRAIEGRTGLSSSCNIAVH
jgi:hypothetical protein